MCLKPRQSVDNLNRDVVYETYTEELDKCDYVDYCDSIKVSNNDFIILQLNIRGLYSKLSQLKALLNAVKRITNINDPVKKITSSKDGCTKRTSRSSVYNMHTHPTPKKVTQCTSDRKCVKVDYSQFDLTSDNPPSPPKKKRTVDLKHKPSATQIAAEKFKTKPSNTLQPVRQQSTVSAPVTTTVTVERVLQQRVTRLKRVAAVPTSKSLFF